MPSTVIIIGSERSLAVSTRKQIIIVFSLSYLKDEEKHSQFRIIIYLHPIQRVQSHLNCSWPPSRCLAFSTLEYYQERIIDFKTRTDHLSHY